MPRPKPISYQSIVKSFSKVLRREFKLDVRATSTKRTSGEPCFYIDIVNPKIVPVGIEMVEHNLIVSIKYFGTGDKLQLYDIGNKLQGLFSRYIEVDNKKILLPQSDINFLEDNYGEYLDFLINLSYYDIAMKTPEEIEEEEALELMREVQINSEVIK